MIPAGRLLLAAVVSLMTFGLWKCFQYLYRQYTSPLSSLRGPKGTSWIYGSMHEIRDAEVSVLHEGWLKQYGSTMKYKSFFFSNRLFTMDLKAIHYILNHSLDYQKPTRIRYGLAQILGKGVLFIEGTQHRQQRNVMNPAFGPAQIRELTEIFLETSIRLRDVLLNQVTKDSAGTSTATRLDIMPWLSKTTLDVIGFAGFNYRFDALNVNQKQTELYHAYRTMTGREQGVSVMPLLQAFIPLLRLLPNARARTLHSSQSTMIRIGQDLLSDAKSAARAGATEKDKIEKSSLQGRDLLSLLVKANTATDIPESQRLSDEDVLAQVPTFLVAGHETTSTATTWALYALSKDPQIQSKLREELLSVETEAPSMDELMALPYLDGVVKETLRVHAPVPHTVRVAMKDDVIPVDKPYVDKYGVTRDSIKIGKGDAIFIPILAINRSQELWGPDAREFKPERWENLPDTISHIPGVWSHLLSFLGGPRACIGWRFSVVEMKALLFTLIRSFEFELAVPVSDIGRKAIIVQNPVLHSDPKSRAQLPLLVKPYKQA